MSSRGRGRAASSHGAVARGRSTSRGSKSADAKASRFANGREVDVESIYAAEISRFRHKKLQTLEFNGYLENYLWPKFDAENTSFEYLMSIIAMVNEKFREGVSVWNHFRTRETEMPKFFDRVFALHYTSSDASSQPSSPSQIRGIRPMSWTERTNYILFFIRCFQSLEDEIIRKCILRLVSLPLWMSMSSNRRTLELSSRPHLQKPFKALQKKYAKADEEGKIVDYYERTFLPSMVEHFLQTVESFEDIVDDEVADDVDEEDGDEKMEEDGDNTTKQAKLLYLERFCELVIDLLSELPTRRFFNAYLQDNLLYLRCIRSNLAQNLTDEGRLFVQLMDIIKFYLGFEINDATGDALSQDDMMAIHSSKLLSLQRISFKFFAEKLRELALANLSKVETRRALAHYLGSLSDVELRRLGALLKLVDEEEQSPAVASASSVSVTKRPVDRDLLMEMLISYHEKRVSQIEAINALPLYPSETVLFDENTVPASENYFGDRVSALPKLNLQFLTIHDYLLRNFNLFRLESTYEIREDLMETVKRMAPRANGAGKTSFAGWSRMSVPIRSFSMKKIGKPKLGELKPSEVLADVEFDTSDLRQHVKQEWEDLKEHDVVFLISIRSPIAHGDKPDESLPFLQRYGVRYVRGAEVKYITDSDEEQVSKGQGDDNTKLKGTNRKLRVLLDESQYYADTLKDDSDVYTSFNVLMRRKPKENNFKAVLETIRDLMNTRAVVPDWLHDLLLGYGDPSSASFTEMPEKDQIRALDFNDTLLDLEHVRSSFPGKELVISSDAASSSSSSSSSELHPPFRVTFDNFSSESGSIKVESYKLPDPGPYPVDKPRQNSVRFTANQMEAIISGMNPGLTMVVGPPGTGKTDVAVQILSNIYHNFPNQRTLIVTHSNQALNDLFEKIMDRDIKERHLIRLGMGSEELETEKDFSKFGRVNYMLQRRLDMLKEVSDLSKSLGLRDDLSYTCETASHFWRQHVVSRWEKFTMDVEAAMEKSGDLVQKSFPFTEFFADVPNLFTGTSFESDLRAAEGCFRHLKAVFDELDECKAFEVLKTYTDRGNYLLSRQAKIIAMTCTHAALKRHDLVALGFQYDNLLMEEAGQILEIETFIPMLLQNPESDKKSRLKRVVLLGDHNQLPPVVKNMAFQKYSQFDQSLFARFVRLGVKRVQLNAQGRMRTSLAELYRWKYTNLGDLPHISSTPAYSRANAGFSFEYQAVDVPDFFGQGESEPTAHFIQNLGEAEYIVSVYQYMRLLGYPADKICILTTYNGQKQLIKEVVERKCALNPMFGKPRKVTTVDKFQGQQSDYVLLSLVRTKIVGHIRDVRRLVVAMSRARLGLYVFCRSSLFEKCYELTPAFSRLLQRPTKLMLQSGEMYPSTRSVDEAGQTTVQVENTEHMLSVVEAMVQHRMMHEQYKQQAAHMAASAMMQHLYHQTAPPVVDGSAPPADDSGASSSVPMADA